MWLGVEIDAAPAHQMNRCDVSDHAQEEHKQGATATHPENIVAGISLSRLERAASTLFFHVGPIFAANMTPVHLPFNINVKTVVRHALVQFNPSVTPKHRAKSAHTAAVRLGVVSDFQVEIVREGASRVNRPIHDEQDWGRRVFTAPARLQQQQQAQLDLLLTRCMSGAAQQRPIPGRSGRRCAAVRWGFPLSFRPSHERPRASL